MKFKLLIPLAAAVAVMAACGDRSNDTGVGGNTSEGPAPAEPTTTTPGTPSTPPENPPTEAAPGETPPPPPNQ